jgi:PAS domain S-box-containing protein
MANDNIREDLRDIPGMMGFSPELVRELDTIGDWGILTTDSNLVVTGWNRWLERQLGHKPEMFLGKTLFEVFPNLLLRNLNQYYQQALNGQTVLLSQRLHRYLLPLRPPKGTERFEYMQQSVRLIPLVQNGHVIGTVTLIEDVTERVAYETELRERVQALREADQRKDEFLAMLAHELRNPLAPISNGIHLLRLLKAPDAMIDNTYDLIDRQVKHLVRLVDDLLDISRVSSGKIILQKMRLDLATVIQQAVETSRPLIETHRHTLTIDLPSQPVIIEGDFVRLAQVFSNILNNAAKYTDESGQIVLTMEATKSIQGSPGKAIIRIKDNGRGIESSALKNLFELFYQVDRNLDRSEGGLGIGLSLVKNLVEMHHGQVSVQSEGRGKGSEFVVQLPLLREQATTTKADSGESQRAAAPQQILIVDDNRDSADSMSMLLRAEGHTTWTAYHGQQAIELAIAKVPTVILLDIGLPEMDGYMVCKAIRDQGLKGTYIVTMSGYARPEDAQMAKDACFDAHFVKPVDLNSLRSLFANLSAHP